MTNCRRFMLSLMLLGFSYTAFSQDIPKKEYYRHFSVQVKNLSQEEFQSLHNKTKTSSVLEVMELCTANSAVLIRVSANYPKRVDDIKTEIEQLVLNEVRQRRILEVKQISFTDRPNFCK